MPRARRIEFAGALYHVLNRGNYRRDLFTVGRTGEAFERALGEACGRFGWVVQAYVVMSNHFHLCLETPEANLSAGMQWLESVFANRFNRFSGGVGHVFQGRFKALLVERGAAQVRLVNYIHLNPVRAGLVPVEELGRHALSSLPKLGTRRCPTWLRGASWLNEIGGLKETPGGLRRYREYLRLREEGDPARSEHLHRELCRGWFIGTKEGKRAAAEEFLLGDDSGGRGQRDPGAGPGYGEAGALARLQLGLGRLEKSPEDLAHDPKGAGWKVALAAWLRARTPVSNLWLGEHLAMGHPNYVSSLLSTYRAANQGRRRRCPFARKLGE